MHPTDPCERLRELERNLLRGLCQPLPDALRERTNRELATYRWRAADHQIIFDALQRIGSTATGSLRERLPAQAVRMGFPDIDWTFFFDPRTDGGTIEKIVSDLQAAAKLA